MGAILNWISPADAADMVFDVREEGCDQIGLALLRPRSRGEARTASALVSAKLQPVRPAPTSWATRCGMPVTARDHRLILAPGVADAVSLERLVADYDAASRPHQRLLAAVLTVKFHRDVALHDGFDAVCCFAQMKIARARRLTSLAVLHAPGDELVEARAHAHIVVLARQHLASGWAGEHPDLTDTSHALWEEEWVCFRDTWADLLT